MPRKLLTIAASIFCSVTNAASVAPECELVISASEKSAQQPARHSITELGGQTLEAIIADEVMYSKMGGTWRKLKSDFGAAERKQIAEMRSGEIALKDCATLGTKLFDGRQTTVVQYRAVIPGAGAFGDGLAKLYIGADGLIYGLETDDSLMRQRYTNVSVPKL